MTAGLRQRLDMQLSASAGSLVPGGFFPGEAGSDCGAGHGPCRVATRDTMFVFPWQVHEFELSSSQDVLPKRRKISEPKEQF